MAFTYFFRDAQTLEVAVDQALPNIRGQAFIDVWDAGCAHGPEPYTLAILLRERLSEMMFRNVRIHATDVDTMFAETVAQGVFREDEVRRIPSDIRARYFRPGPMPGQVEVVDEVRRKVAFRHHDLLSLEPIRESLSLIVCKNVLLHFDPPQRESVIRMFHRALRPDGLLAMENTQKMPEPLSPIFQQLAGHAQVYRRLDPPRATGGPTFAPRARLPFSRPETPVEA